MFNQIVKLFIKDSENISRPDVREKYGTLCSILSIICNGVMVIFKLLFGYLTHSVAIQADGLNNLSDMGSNLATFLALNWRVSILIVIILMVMEDMNILQDWLLLFNIISCFFFS